jgi:hypothetical protein
VAPQYKSKRRQQRYDQLLAERFLPYEAREFSKLRKNDPALIQIRARRSGQVTRFEKRIRGNDWGVQKSRVEWHKTIERFYKRRKMFGRGSWTVRFGSNKGKPSPWEWYRAIRDYLPAELERDSPKSKARPPADVSFDTTQSILRLLISNLKRSIGNATGDQLEQYIKQRKDLERCLKDRVSISHRR